MAQINADFFPRVRLIVENKVTIGCSTQAWSFLFQV